MISLSNAVDWVDTFDPIMSTIHGIGLSSKAANPNTAKLFIDFVLSKRSQQRIRDLRLVPSRRDIEPLVPKMDQSKLANMAKSAYQAADALMQVRAADRD